jgi:hypothetical protein
MMIVIKAAKELLEANRAEAWRYPTVWEPVVDRLAVAVKDLEPAPNMRLVPVSLLNEMLEGRQNADTFIRLTKIVEGE